MEALEIILLIFGLAIFILSFAIPEKKSKISQKDKELGEEFMSELVDDQLEVISAQLDLVLDEKNEDHIERLERRMERLSNEKIMAVGEYSDTVLGDIKKSHDEVVFLYDMLNTKHKSLNMLVEKIDRLNLEQEKILEKKEFEIQKPQENKHDEFLPLKPKVVEARVPNEQRKTTSKRNQEINRKPSVAIQFSKRSSMGQNSNERILKLHKEGKSNMLIAKELGLGIGEVKLVIDLFKGM